MERMREIVFGTRNRIGRRLIVSIIAFSSLITLLISIAQLGLEYRELRGGIDRQFEAINVYVPNIAASMWDFDERQIQLALDALIRLPNIERAWVTTPENRKRWSAGDDASPSTLTRAYPLHHELRGAQAEIGRLEVVASLSAVYRQVAGRAASIVVSNGLKTFVVALFMAFLLRRLVTRRLEKLALKVDKLVPDALPLPHPAQDEPKSMPAHFDELQAVEWGMDNTAHSLGVAATALKCLNQELADQVAEKEALLQNALVGIVMVRERKMIYCNGRFEQIFGYGSGAMLGQSTRILYPTEQEWVDVGKTAYDTLSRAPSFSTTALVVKRDGTQFWAEMAGRAIAGAHPRGESIWIFSDVTQRKTAEQRIEFIAYHDALTELPNRLLAYDRFQQAAAASRRTQSKIAILCLDLDNFKTINDSLGHAIGDGVIKQVAIRMTECVSGADTVSRIGGDEFMIMLPGLPNTDAAAPILARLMERILLPLEIDGHELSTSISIGVALFPEDGTDFDTLMKRADMAMYRAKDAGRNTFFFFDEQMNVYAIEQLSMCNALRRALERHEFVLHYQPQIDLASDMLIGVEALIRWNHPEFGMIPPARFIPIAEDSGLIVPIGEWVLREACSQAAAWSKTTIGKMVMAVNLSAAQFKRGDLEQSVISAIEESGIDASMLELELTESILIQDTESTLAAVKRLKRLGVRLSIDDFGTGYSSLSYLKRFKVDKLKIDQSFVRDLATDPDDAAIVRAIIQMAHGLGLTTVAEGVENEKVLAQLRAFGCDEAQGYLFARPMPAEMLTRYLQTTRIRWDYMRAPTLE